MVAKSFYKWSTVILLGTIPGMVATMQSVARRVEPFLGNALGRALRARDHIVLWVNKNKQNKCGQR